MRGAGVTNDGDSIKFDSISEYSDIPSVKMPYCS